MGVAISTGRASARSALRTAGPWLVLAGAILAVYLRAAPAPFVLDDQWTILHNPSIRTLWPPGVSLSPPQHYPTAGRPLVNLSFAVSHALGGRARAGYRRFGFALHALSAGLLFALVRRTLEHCAPRRDGTLPPFLVAALWALHPLNSEAVVCVTQRTELMMGLASLATLHASVRHWDAGSPGAAAGWRAVAGAACFAGMACEESRVSAPLSVLLYDRAFRAGSLASAWRGLRGLYVGLSASWLLLLAVNDSGPRLDSAGFHLEVSPVAWWLTQAKVFWM